MSSRLTYDDHVFLATRTALRMPVVSQTAWRFRERVDEAALTAYRDALLRGPLRRQVRLASVPGARDRWVVGAPAAPVRVEPDPIKPGDVVRWLDAQAETDIDPTRGPGFVLALTHTTDGGSVVSFLTSHVIADGGLKVRALAAAGRGEELPVLPGPAVDDDLRDAGRQVAAAAVGLGSALRHAVETRRGRREPVAPLSPAAQSSSLRPVPPPRAGEDEPYTAPTVIVDTPASEWLEAAEREGGTANSLFVGICVELLLAAGLVEPGRPVRVAVPVATRGQDDLRSNATSAIAIDVDAPVDLHQVRAEIRARIGGFANGTAPDPLEPLKPLIRLMPDAVVRRVVDGIPMPLAIASNLGRVDDAVLAPFGTPAVSVLNRAVGQRMSRNLRRRQRGGLTAWLTHGGDTMTACFTGVDPDVIPAEPRLRALVEGTYAGRGLSSALW